jgi:hypothetical protein
MDAPSHGPDTPEALFAPGEISQLIARLFDAARTHWARIVGAGLVLALIAFGWTRISPRVYTAHASVFAIPADGSSGGQRGAAGEVVGLSDGAARVVLSEEALDELIRRLRLDRDWPGAPEPLDELSTRVGLAPSETNPHQALLAALRKAITVKVEDSAVDITVAWSEPATAQAIAQACVERLLAARHQVELAPIETKVAALQGRVGSADAQVQAHQERLAELLASKRRGVKAATVFGLQSRGKFRDLPDPQLSTLRQQILEKRKAIAEQEDVRARELAQLQALLAEQRATLGPANPLVLDTQDKLRALDAQGSQLETLKAAEQKLLGDFVRAGGNERELHADAGPLFPPELENDDPNVAFERSALSAAMLDLQNLRSELLDAQLALDSQQATFKARYLEMLRPEAPAHPSSPKTPLTCLAALLVGCLTALLWSLVRPARGALPRRVTLGETVRG